MSDQHARVVEIVLAVADELNPSLEEPVELARGADAPLYGEEGPLDSLALVTLTSTVEQRLEDEFGVMVTLTDERAFSQARSPFQSVGALAGFATELLQPSLGAV
jgi:acyl carrier protein